MEDLALENSTAIFGERQGMFKRVFGCWHLKLSRPTTTNHVTYQYCVKCGMRRNYDLDSFEPTGSFYLPPIAKNIHFV
jgi:hypothetical protein